MTGGGENLPIILSEDIANLEPAYLWFSGGRIQIKMGVSVSDFKKYFGDRVIVAKIQWKKWQLIKNELEKVILSVNIIN